MVDYIRSESCYGKTVQEAQTEEAEDCEEDTIDHIDLIRRINEAWPPNRERDLYLLH